MKRRKTLKELTIKNNFMFGAVMSDERNCKELLEMVTDVFMKTIKVPNDVPRPGILTKNQLL